MIYYHESDITDTDCIAIIHGVNCQGKMASGVAKAIRAKWPEAYESYIEFCDSYSGKPPLGFVDMVCTSDDKVIGNCFTQEYYGRDGKRYAHPIAVLNSVTQFCINLDKVKMPGETLSIAMPKIGCGLGGLNWENDVLPIIQKLNIDFHIDFHVYDNHAKP